MHAERRSLFSLLILLGLSITVSVVAGEDLGVVHWSHDTGG